MPNFAGEIFGMVAHNTPPSRSITDTDCSQNDQPGHVSISRMLLFVMGRAVFAAVILPLGLYSMPDDLASAVCALRR